MWKRLANKLLIQEPRGKPFRGTSLEDLQEFEHRHQFAFPQSYRAFVIEIGAGYFGNFTSILAPDFGMEEELVVRGLPLFKEIYTDKAFIDRMMPFGSTCVGDQIVWDPDDVTSKRCKDYGIYILPRDACRIVRLCSDFKTFVNQFCFGRGFLDALGIVEDSDWNVEYTMQRFRPDRRKKRHAVM